MPVPFNTGGWGSGGFGLSPWGYGAGSVLVLESALAIKENVVRLHFNLAPRFTGTLEPHDAASLDRYNIVTIPGGVGIDEEPVRPVLPAAVERPAVPGAAGTLIDLTTDRPFSRWPCQYRVSCNNLIAATTGAPLAAGQSVVFYAVRAGIPSFEPDVQGGVRDIGNPMTKGALFDPLPTAATADSLILGTYQPDGLGDYASDEGIVSYKKRVFRRLMTRRDAYAHLLGYGIDLPSQVGRLARPGVRESLAVEAERQIGLEPETVAVRVTVVVDANNVTRYRVFAQTKLGDTTFDVPLPNP